MVFNLSNLEYRFFLYCCKAELKDRVNKSVEESWKVLTYSNLINQISIFIFLLPNLLTDVRKL